jgi:hypothetical protein
MRTNYPESRRKFRSEWDQIDYLYHKMLYWFYGPPHSVARAKPFARRLKPLLDAHAGTPEAILGESAWSLYHEVQGNLPLAIKHRENEIRLIRKLLRLCEAQKCYDVADLISRMELLALLYDQDGDTPQARRLLRKARALCAEHRLPFEGEDLLAEIDADG